MTVHPVPGRGDEAEALRSSVRDSRLPAPTDPAGASGCTAGAGDVLLREAVLADAPALFEAHLDSVRNLCAGAYSETQLGAWFEGRSPEIYRPALGAGRIWLVERSGRVLGFVGFEPGEVTLLFVRREAAGLGLGQRLFRFGLAQAAAGFTGPLTVVATRNSQPFYQAHGFQAVEEDTLVRGAAEIRIPVVRMQKVLPGES